MVSPLRTPTITPNVQLANTSTQTQHFQELFYQVKVWMVAMGATISQSYGGATAGAGDNIPNAAAVNTGSAGSGGSWFVASFTNFGGAAFTILFNVNDNSSPFQNCQIRAGNATWNTSVTSALPTVNTGFATANTAVVLDPFTDNRNKRYSTWYSTNNSGAQSAKFLVKEEGGAVTSNVCLIEMIANTDADGGGDGAARWAIGIHGALTATSFQSSSNWIGVNVSSAALNQPQVDSAIWRLCSSWGSGVDINGEIKRSVPEIGYNSSSGRLIGAWIDTFAIPQNSTLGTYSDSTESLQSQRRMNFGHVAFFWPASTAVL